MKSKMKVKEKEKEKEKQKQKQKKYETQHGCAIPTLLYEQDKKILYAQPEEIQNETLQTIMSGNADTIFGREYLFNEITDMRDFRTYVPLSLYSDVHPYIQTMIGGKTNTLVKEPVTAWAKMDTMGGQVSLVPYTRSVSRSITEAFLLLYTSCAAHNLIAPDQYIFSGLESLYIDTLDTIPVGTFSSLGLRDLSTFPGIGPLLTPSFNRREITPLTSHWKKIASKTPVGQIGMILEDPVLFAMFIKCIQDTDMLVNMKESSPLLFVSYDPIQCYESLLKSLLGPLLFRQIMCTQGIPVAVQLDSHEGCVPLSTHHVFEFISLREWKDMEAEGEYYREFEFSPRYLSTVTEGEEYILVITTSGGLYRYITGDIVTMMDTHHMKRVGSISIPEKKPSNIPYTMMIHQ